MSQYGMAIRIDRCVACGACALACKTENNTENKNGGTTYNWADYLAFTGGTFSGGDVKFRVYPVNCNHCTDAACVEVCPVTPKKAMYKTADGITMHNDDRCIGCRLCQGACPYSTKDVDADGVQYSVISFNPWSGSQSFWDDTSKTIKDCTSSPAEVAAAATVTPPYMNEYTHPDYRAVRPAGVVEKCIFCDHRVKNGENPYCVDSCPAGARVFGDTDDYSSEISQLLRTYGYKRLKDNSGSFLSSGESGTNPNVYYIGDGGTSSNIKTAEVKETIKPLLIYPNPASDKTHVEFEVKAIANVEISVYDITGKKVMQINDIGIKTIGKHKVNIDISRLKAGTYICRVQTGNNVNSANFVVMR